MCFLNFNGTTLSMMADCEANSVWRVDLRALNLLSLAYTP